MIRKEMARNTNPIKVNKNKKDLEHQHTEKNNNLIFGRFFIAMTSIGLLIFVLRDNVFHLT
tara:strand:- start:2549 stop:2731 length:183 start_codon:yes stop_codon:yes gene_type:complete